MDDAGCIRADVVAALDWAPVRGAGGRDALVPLPHPAPQRAEPRAHAAPRAVPHVQRPGRRRPAGGVLRAEAGRARRRVGGVAHRRLPRAAGDVTAQSIDEVLDLFERHGAERYDEEIFQLAHAEQTAALAQAAGATDARGGRRAAARRRPPPRGRRAAGGPRPHHRPAPRGPRIGVAGRAVPAGRHRADRAPRAGQALPLRRRPELPRRAVARLRGQPRAPGRPDGRRRGGRLRGQPRLGRTPSPSAAGTTRPRSPTSRSHPPLPTAPSSSPSARSDPDPQRVLLGRPCAFWSTGSTTSCGGARRSEAEAEGEPTASDDSVS